MNFRERLKGKSEYIVTGIAVLGVLVLAVLWCVPYYPTNDDPTMKSILSGAYTGTPDGHAIYMKYPLTGILSLFYRMTDKVSWFDVFMFACFWVAISSVVVRTYGRLKDLTGRKKTIAICATAGSAVLCFALFLPQLFMLHYTVVAAMIGGCGLFLFMTGGGIMPIVLLTLCYCIRSQVFFMLLPFLVVVLLWKILDKNGKNILKQILVLGVAVVVCMIWNNIMYRSEGWQYYEEYNESRTRLYDYDMPLNYEDNAEAYEAAGISPMQHRLLEEYALILAEDITPDMMVAAAGITATKKSESLSGGEYLLYCVKEYYYHLRYNDGPYNYILLGGCLAVLVLLLREKQWLKLALLGCFLGGRSLIWVYLIWQGRFPERVYVSLYILEIMVLAGMLLQLLRDSKRTKENTEVSVKWKAWSGVILCLAVNLFLVFAGVKLGAVMCERAYHQAENHEEWLALMDYCEANPGMTYILDVYSTVGYSGKMLECEEQKQNYLLAGGWMSASPLLLDKLEATEPAEWCYIIAADRDVSWLYDYCEERLEGTTIEKTGDINLNGTVLFDVYRPVKK